MGIYNEVLQSIMTTMFTGAGNRGLQIGYSSGSIEAHFHAERPETPPQPSCFVPFPRDADFVNRGTLLEQIHQRCSAPASRVALVGLAGVGKSQLAIEHCYRTAERSPDTWVFWANASDTAQLEQSFCEIANQVKIRGRKDPQANMLKLVHDWLRDVRNGRWLLVLDNADDVAVLSPTNGSSAVHYLPPSSHGSVLMMSRTKRAAMQIVEDSEIIPVEPMDDESASALLRKKLRSISEEKHDSCIRELATELDRVPLALIQAAAYIRERAPRYSVRQYLEEYRQSDTKKTSLLNREAGHLRRDKAASNSILATWQISFDHIRNTRPTAAELLSLMSFFDRHRIQEILLRRRSSIVSGDVSVIKNDDFEDDVLTLRDYSFITVTRDAKTFEIHSLVQLATREWLEIEGQLDKWRSQSISNICAEMPAAKFENWEKCDALFPHARATLAHRPKDQWLSIEWAQMLTTAASYALNCGRAGEAEPMLVVAWDVRKDFLGEKHKETLISMALVGIAKSLIRKYDEAEAIFRQMLPLCEEVCGQKCKDTLMIAKFLAATVSRQGKYKEAQIMLKHQLALCKQVYGIRHQQTLMCMDTLAMPLLHQGKYNEAEMMARLSLAMSRKVFRHENPVTLQITTHLAVVLRKQAKYEEAEAMYRQALIWSKKLLGHEHPQTLIKIGDLARVLFKQQKYQEAEAMHRQMLVIHEKVLGHRHVHTLRSVYCLALCLAAQHRHDEALPLFKRAFVESRNVHGKDHPITLTRLEAYAKVLSIYQAHQQVSTSSSQAGNTGELKETRLRSQRGLAKVGIRSSELSGR